MNQAMLTSQAGHILRCAGRRGSLQGARRGSLEKGNGRTEEELALAAVERLPEILPCARAAIAAD